MTRYKRAYSKCTFCGIWPVFANPVTYVDVATITITVTITLETKNAIQSNGDGLIIHLL